MDLNDIRCFARVVEQQSLTAAADSLETSKAGVSRALQRLETDLGVRLIQRTTRRLRLTTAGRELFENIHGALERLDEAADQVSAIAQEPSGIVRMTGPDVGGLLLPRIIADFSNQHPKIQIELSLTSRVVDLVEEGFDLAVRSGRLRSSSLVSQRVANQTSRLYASEEYLRRRGRPRSLAELANHSCVVISRRNLTEGSGTQWRLVKDGQLEEIIAVDGPLRVDDLTAACEAVRLGLGIGLIPQFLAVSIPDLIRILPTYQSPATPISVVWPSRRLEPFRVVLFRSFLIKRLSKAIRER